MRRLAAVAALVALALPADALPRIQPLAGHPWWPIHTAVPLQPPTAGSGGTLTAIAGSYSSFTYDPGYLDSDTLFIRDYEVWVSQLTAALPVGESTGVVPPGTLLGLHLTVRGMWPGFLDGIIDLHHNVTGLPDAGRGERDRYELFTMIVDDTEIDENAIDSYRDAALLLQTESTLSPAVGAALQLPLAGATMLVGWSRPVVLAAIGGGTLPPARPGSGGAGYLTAGGTFALTQIRPARRLTAELSAGAWLALYPAGRGEWRPVLATHPNWHARVLLSSELGAVTVDAALTAQRTPFRFQHSRICGVATSVDMAAAIPIAGGELLLAFVQDLVTFITPDFGVSVGWRATLE